MLPFRRLPNRSEKRSISFRRGNYSTRPAGHEETERRADFPDGLQRGAVGRMAGYLGRAPETLGRVRGNITQAMAGIF